MSTSPGPARPRLQLSLALCTWRCRCPLLLCCLLMLASSASLHADPDKYLAALTPSTGKTKINLTELHEDGRLIQVVNSEHIQGGSRLYLVPPPGPRVLIQVNFTRIQTGGGPSPQVEHGLGDSLNFNRSSNNTANAGRDGEFVEQDVRSKSELEKYQLRASVASRGKQETSGRSGSLSPGGASLGWDMLAVGDIRRQRLHHPEGDQLKHKQPVATAPSRSNSADGAPHIVDKKNKLPQPTTDETSLGKKAKFFNITASTILSNASKIQWSRNVTANETDQDISPSKISNGGKLFPSSVKATESPHRPVFNTLQKVHQLPPELKRSASSTTSSSEETRENSARLTVAGAGGSAPSRLDALSHGRDDFVSGYDSLVTQIGDGNNTNTTIGLTADNSFNGNRSAPNNTSHRHPDRLSRPTPVTSSSAASSPPVFGEDGLSSLSSTKSFRARDSLGSLSPTLTLSETDGGQAVDGISRVLTHTEYSQTLTSETDPVAPSQDCSLKVIIEETESSGALTTGTGPKQRAQPQVICWQSEGRSPLVYRYTTPIRITYLWADEKTSGLTLKFSFPSLDEVECHFQCSTAPHLCLVSQQLCDGYTDCPDQSDELPTVCDSALNQGITENESKVPQVIASVVIPSGVILIIFVVFLMIKHKLLGHPAGRSGDSLLSSPQAHSSEAGHSSQDSGQNEALLPDRPPPYGQLHQESQQQQQHEQLLTYTGASVVSSLQPAQAVPGQHNQYLLQQHHQQHQQQKQHHRLLYQQLQYPNNNTSGQNINNNDLPGAVSFQEQHVYQLHQEQQHMLLQHPLPSPGSHHPRDRIDVHHRSPVSSAFNDNSSINPCPREIGVGFQQHLYNNPLSNNDDSEHNRGNTAGSHLNQYTHTLHHQQHQRHHRQSKQAQPVTNPLLTSGFPTMSVVLPQQQCPPHIPVSLDGEEGYSAAQKSLHSKRQMEQNLEAEYGIFRAPPNRSALERDSPPPPYSLQPPSTKGFSLDSLLSGSYFSSSCPTSFISSSSPSPVSTRGGRSRGGGGQSQDSPSPHNNASSTPPNRH